MYTLRTSKCRAARAIAGRAAVDPTIFVTSRSCHLYCLQLLKPPVTFRLRTELENHGHDAGIADFFLLMSCFSMLTLIFFISFVYISCNVSYPPIRFRGSSYFKRNGPPDPSHTDPPLSFSIFAVSHCKCMAAQG